MLTSAIYSCTYLIWQLDIVEQLASPNEDDQDQYGDTFVLASRLCNAAVVDLICVSSTDTSLKQNLELFPAIGFG